MPKTASVLYARRLRRTALRSLALASVVAIGLAAQQSDSSPELFSTVMQRVSAQPEFRERVLEGIREVPKVGEFLSPDLVDRLRVLILGKEWQRVDHFPALHGRCPEQECGCGCPSGGEVDSAVAAVRSARHRRVPTGTSRNHRPRSSRDKRQPMRTIRRRRSGRSASISRWVMDPIPRLRPCTPRAGS